MVLGPYLLMDKSTIQGLNFDCFQYIGRYYQHLISPILLRELISDLAKEEKNSSDVELKKIVGILAAKINSPQSFMLPDALKMAYNELLGGFVPMDGRIPLEHGISVDVLGLGRGTFFDENPYIYLLRKWAGNVFSVEDLQKAKAIRDEDTGVNLEELYKTSEKELALPKFQTLEEMVAWAEKMHFSPTNPEQLVLNASHHILGQRPDLFEKAIRRWESMGRPELMQFAPFSFHYYKVEIIHFLSLLCGFVSRSKKGKAHLDAQYLYYLPFCNIFSTGDKDLMKLVPFFLKKEQKLISKSDFQSDLKELSQYFSNLSVQETKTFHIEYGFYPPNLENSFTSNMWSQFMRPRRPREGEASKPSLEEAEKIMQELRAIQDAIAKHYQNQDTN